MLKLIKSLIITSALALGCLFGTASMAGETLQRVIDFQVLKVGMSGTQPPMNAVNRSGQLMGYDVDLARAMAAAMKVKLEIKPIPFGELMVALQANEIDMVISGMAITPARTEQVSFIGPYMMSGKSILTKDSTLTRIDAGDAFKRKGLKLVALQNSTSATFISTQAPDATLIEVEKYDDAVAMVIAGTADAMVADMPACILAVLRYPDAGLTTLKQPLTVEPVGIAVNKNDPQFLNLVGNYLEAYSKTGVMAQLRKKWFEEKGWIAALP